MATDGKDGHGLKLEKIMPTFSDAMPVKLTKGIVIVSEQEKKIGVI